MYSQPGSMTFDSLKQKISNGEIKIPQFQRDFVWSIEASAKLLDSIIKGFPIGTFIIWKTRERLRSVRNVGGMVLPETPAGDSVQYVLDGQQRITSLYAALMGSVIQRDGKDIDYAEIYIDLSAQGSDQIVITDISEKTTDQLIKIKDLLYGSLTFLLKYNDIPGALEKIEKYKQIINSYAFSTILVEDASLDVATEIFTRINVGGKALTCFEIMVAKTYDESRSFDLSVKYEELINDLRDSNYDTLSSSAVLQCVAICILKNVKTESILKIDRSKFIDEWDNVVEALKSTVDYFRSGYGVPVSYLLPYEALLVLFTYYFYNHKDRPLGDQAKWLRDYFWRAIITERFSSSSDTKINGDVSRFDSIIADTKPTDDIAVDISPDYIKQHGNFTTNSAFIKGVLCILAAQHPQSFIDNTEVAVDNSRLKQSNSRNYHHFFPRAYMRKNQPTIEEWLVNHVANITIVDDFMNKRVIKDRAPSNYINEFTSNPSLSDALATHLIEYNASEDSGIGSNDYNKFFNARLKRISEQFKNRIIFDSNRSKPDRE